MGILDCRCTKEGTLSFLDQYHVIILAWLFWHHDTPPSNLQGWKNQGRRTYVEISSMVLKKRTRNREKVRCWERRCWPWRVGIRRSSVSSSEKVEAVGVVLLIVESGIRVFSSARNVFEWLNVLENMVRWCSFEVKRSSLHSSCKYESWLDWAFTVCQIWREGSIMEKKTTKNDVNAPKDT